MEMDERKPEPMCPIVDIDGFIADGKQFDLDITLANDRRNVIFGVVRDNFKGKLTSISWKDEANIYIIILLLVFIIDNKVKAIIPIKNIKLILIKLSITFFITSSTIILTYLYIFWHKNNKIV